eukprot:10086248-Alexandrium_andersonii.AAC.1
MCIRDSGSARAGASANARSTGPGACEGRSSKQSWLETPGPSSASRVEGACAGSSTAAKSGGCHGGA